MGGALCCDNFNVHIDAETVIAVLVLEADVALVCVMAVAVSPRTWL